MGAINNASAYFRAAMRASNSDDEREAVSQRQSEYLSKLHVESGRNTITPLAVPFADRHAAYAAGARRHQSAGAWYAPAHTPLWRVALWLQSMDPIKPKAMERGREQALIAIKQWCTRFPVERTGLVPLIHQARAYNISVRYVDLIAFAATSEHPARQVYATLGALNIDLPADVISPILTKAAETFLCRWQLDGQIKNIATLGEHLQLIGRYLSKDAARQFLLRAQQVRPVPSWAGLE